jgi:hypothetical protein
MKNDQIRQIEKKAYEVAYAIFRICGNIGNRPIAGYLESHCLSLFDAAIYGNEKAANAEAKILEYYLRLGSDTGLINYGNAEVIISEIGKMNAAIAEHGAIAVFPEPIKLIFSGNGNEEKSSAKITADIQKKEIPTEVINRELEAITNSEDLPEEIQAASERHAPEQQAVRQNPPQAAMRQSAIVQKIRQSGNCRMKDVIETFPEVSERTLRYDLERLVTEGVVEKVGQGGPSTFYRVGVGAKS